MTKLINVLISILTIAAVTTTYFSLKHEAILHYIDVPFLMALYGFLIIIIAVTLSVIVTIKFDS